MRYRGVIKKAEPVVKLSQKDRILIIVHESAKPLTPFEIWESSYALNLKPLASLRRALTELVQEKKLRHGNPVMGESGRPSKTYKLPRKKRNENKTLSQSEVPVLENPRNTAPCPLSAVASTAGTQLPQAQVC